MAINFNNRLLQLNPLFHNKKNPPSDWFSAGNLILQCTLPWWRFSTIRRLWTTGKGTTIHGHGELWLGVTCHRKFFHTVDVLMQWHMHSVGSANKQQLQNWQFNSGNTPNSRRLPSSAKYRNQAETHLHFRVTCIPYMQSWYWAPYLFPACLAWQNCKRHALAGSAAASQCRMENRLQGNPPHLWK